MADVQSQQQTTRSSTIPSGKIRVVVRNRDKVLFDDEVKSVSSKNDTGSFDILPEHTNFITLIKSPLTIRMSDGKIQEIALSNGIIKVKDNEVYCYIDLLVKGVVSNTKQI